MQPVRNKCLANGPEWIGRVVNLEQRDMGVVRGAVSGRSRQGSDLVDRLILRLCGVCWTCVATAGGSALLWSEFGHLSFPAAVLFGLMGW